MCRSKTSYYLTIFYCIAATILASCGGSNSTQPKPAEIFHYPTLAPITLELHNIPVLIAMETYVQNRTPQTVDTTYKTVIDTTITFGDLSDSTHFIIFPDSVSIIDTMYHDSGFLPHTVQRVHFGSDTSSRKVRELTFYEYYDNNGRNTLDSREMTLKLKDRSYTLDPATSTITLTGSDLSNIELLWESHFRSGPSPAGSQIDRSVNELLPPLSNSSIKITFSRK